MFVSHVTPPHLVEEEGFNLEAALAAAHAGDTYTTDEKGNVIRDEPMSDDEYDAWEKAIDARIMASTPSP
jgi:hypothetical protein